ncbi:AraC family transcriptional regulator [Paenibacillus albicereus]|uniref:AraC family transcriptional regulator n=1 Tax=Paenibacillus albicereus TaxID=2726185 RepID=A0A6H2GXM0_9BACL|nr:AraC family transcriptional regulator [Paenibacillus albicereus]QJC51916.1 AraC family transcriptional regulator [Paenibacillus albicereus]
MGAHAAPWKGAVALEFHPLTLRQELAVEQLVSFHYFEYPKGYLFEGESHDFWELLYVDKGEVEVRADDRLLRLAQGSIVFHKPGEFHTVRVGEEHRPPNLIVVAFVCRSPLMDRLRDRTAALEETERAWLSMLLREGFASFQPPYHDPLVHELRRAPDAPPASEQMLRLSLELLLLSQIRKSGEPQRRTAAHAAQPLPAEGSDAMERLQAYIVERLQLGEAPTLDELCRSAHLGRSRLRELTQQHAGTGPTELVRRLRLDAAKSMIRERRYSLTEIADRLGYSSLHYFSRDFKRLTGMAPSEYGRTALAAAGLLPQPGPGKV